MSRINIFNYKELTPALAIGGQPANTQYEQLRQEGYEAIIHINVKEAHYNISNAQYFTRKSGLEYSSMETSFAEPTPENFAEFATLMDKHNGKKIYVHCAAGFCSSLMMVMYQMSRQDLDLDTAIERYAIDNWVLQSHWQPFIESVLSSS